MKKEYEVQLRWRAFPLRPDTPEEGTPMDKIFSHLSAADYKALKERLKKAADDEGLPFGDRVMTFNSRLAHELGKWAAANGKGDEFHHALFVAYLVEGKNIGKMSVLLDAAESIGLSRPEAEEVLKNRTYKNEVDDDWALTENKVITAAPSFVLDDAKLVGAQPYEVMAKFMDDNGVQKRDGQ